MEELLGTDRLLGGFLEWDGIIPDPYQLESTLDCRQDFPHPILLATKQLSRGSKSNANEKFNCHSTICHISCISVDALIVPVLSQLQLLYNAP